MRDHHVLAILGALLIVAIGVIVLIVANFMKVIQLIVFLAIVGGVVLALYGVLLGAGYIVTVVWDYFRLRKKVDK